MSTQVPERKSRGRPRKTGSPARESKQNSDSESDEEGLDERYFGPFSYISQVISKEMFILGAKKCLIRMVTFWEEGNIGNYLN